MGRKSKMILALVLSLLLLPFGLLSGITVEADSNPTVRYRTHVQRDGWQAWRSNGQMSGTSGRALRLEGIEINLQGANGGIRYRTHVQRDGWQGWRSNGQMSGTSGRALRLEGIQIELTGNIRNTHHIEYRTHVQGIGWQAWVRDGAVAGTSGRGLSLEGIEIRLVRRNALLNDNILTPSTAPLARQTVSNESVTVHLTHGPIARYLNVFPWAPNIPTPRGVPIYVTIENHTNDSLGFMSFSPSGLGGEDGIYALSQSFGEGWRYAFPDLPVSFGCIRLFTSEEALNRGIRDLRVEVRRQYDWKTSTLLYTFDFLWNGSTFVLQQW